MVNVHAGFLGKSIIVGVGDDRAFAVLAADGQMVPLIDANDFDIDALFDEYVGRRVVVEGDEIDRSLDGGEISRAVGGDGEIGRFGAGTGGTSREAPIIGAGQSGPIGVSFENAGVNRDVITFAVTEGVIGRIDACFVAGNDDGVISEAVDSADGLGAGFLGDVDGGNWGIGLGIKDANFSGRARDGW